MLVRVAGLGARRAASDGRVRRHRQDTQGQKDYAEESKHRAHTRPQECRPGGAAGKARQISAPGPAIAATGINFSPVRLKSVAPWIDLTVSEV